MARPEADTAPRRPAAAALCRAAAALLLFLAPLKFGNPAVVMEIQFLPGTVLEWWLSAWPPWLLPPLAGVTLLIATACYPPAASRGAAGTLHLAAWATLLLACLFGTAHTTELDAATQFTGQVIGVLAALAAFSILLHNDPQSRALLFAALTAGVLLAALSAWHQAILGGFARTLQHAYETGMDLHPNIVTRMLEGRAFAAFVLPNSLAGHLLLVSPLATVTAWRWGERFHPPRFGRPVLAGMVAGVIGIAFVAARSRAAVVALLGGAVWCLLRQARWNRRTVALAVGGGALAVALFAVVSGGRDLASFDARTIYYRACVQMVAENPLAGVGLGEFQTHYMRLKPPGAEETDHPHAMLLGLTAQCGLPGALGGLALALVCLFPDWIHGPRTWRNPAPTAEALAAQLGPAAWILHSQVDMNTQIPASLLCAALLPLLAFPRRPPLSKGDDPPAGASRRRRLALAGCVLLALAALLPGYRWPGEAAVLRHREQVGRQAPYARIAESANRASRLLPFSPYPGQFHAPVAWAVGERQQALDLLRESVARAPHRAAFRARLAQALWQLGDAEEARRQAREAHAWYPTKSAYSDLLDHFERAQGPDSARAPDRARPAPPR